jgi:hypothetical protein
MVAEPGTRARVIGPTNDHIHNVLGKYLAEFLGPHLADGSYYVEGKGWNGGRARVIRLKNGSICELKSLKDDPDAHSGRSCHIVAFDEPPTLAHYTENAARVVDTQGVVIIAATMVNRPVAWLREMVQGSDKDPGPGRTSHGSGWIQYVATFNGDACPWYSEEQIAEWISTMESSPWEYGQRVLASWDGVTAERILVGIDESNIVDSRPEGEVSIGLAFDHGTAAGSQAAILFAYRGLRTWVLDEIVAVTATTPEEDARECLRMLRKHGLGPEAVDFAVGDLNVAKGYAGWRVNDALEAAFKAQTNSRAAPFHIQAPDKTAGSVDWGLRVLNYAGRRGDLQISPRCRMLVAAVRHWKGGKTGKDGEFSHVVDALRYGVVGIIGASPRYAKLRFD